MPVRAEPPKRISRGALLWPPLSVVVIGFEMVVLGLSLAFRSGSGLRSGTGGRERDIVDHSHVGHVLERVQVTNQACDVQEVRVLVSNNFVTVNREGVDDQDTQGDYQLNNTTRP
jgi:hypothetical protein